MKKIDRFFCVAFIAGTIYFASYNILTRLFEIDFQAVEFLYKVALVTILVSAGWCLGKGISPIKGTTPKQGSRVR